MDVILLEKLENLGNLGDMVSVKPGYGRNFLIPGGKAVFATEANRAAFELRRAELEKAAGDTLAAANSRAKELENLVLTIVRKAGEEGKLFGSVGTTDIAEAIGETGVEVSKQEVRLPSGALRHTGEFQVDIHLHPEVNATVTINIVGEE